MSPTVPDPSKKRLLWSRGRKDQLFFAQMHSHDHFLGRCAGGAPTSREKGQAAICPLCLRGFGYDELTLDHAPPRGGQSRLGGSYSLVLTCKECNNDCEAEAIGFRDSTATDLQNSSACPAHGPLCGQSQKGLPSVMVVDWTSRLETATIVDAKSAFLIAFLSLGYSWAKLNRLDSLRQSIRVSGRVDPNDRLVMVGSTRGSGVPSVMEMREPLSMVIVSPGKLGQVSVILPTHRSGPLSTEWFQSATASGPLLGMSVPWVNSAGDGATGRATERSWDEGQIGHIDRCASRAKHRSTVGPNMALNQSLNRGRKARLR